jgi:rod shape determining protein RodA
MLPLIFGAISRGATRWLQIGDITLQPSELVKPFLLLTFVHLAQSREKWSMFWLILAIILPVILIFLQPDLGTVLVICVGWLICAITRFSTKQIILWSILGIVCLVPVYEFVLHDYQRERITTFIDPYADPLGKGYHVIQSLIAVGSGQIVGRGLGHGPQSQLQFLPEHTTDFIFASLSESFGFVGSATVLIIYLVLLRHVYDISKSTSDPLASLYCVAIIATFGFQIWVNIGMNIGIAPVTGITLPLMSRGGSSLISTALSLAIVNRISSGSKKFQ